MSRERALPIFAALALVTVLGLVAALAFLAPVPEQVLREALVRQIAASLVNALPEPPPEATSVAVVAERAGGLAAELETRLPELGPYRTVDGTFVRQIIEDWFPRGRPGEEQIVAKIGTARVLRVEGGAGAVRDDPPGVSFEPLEWKWLDGESGHLIAEGTVPAAEASSFSQGVFLRACLDRTPWGIRLLAWILTLITLPYALLPVVSRVLAKESNLAGFFLWLGISAPCILLGIGLFGASFRTAGDIVAVAALSILPALTAIVLLNRIEETGC